MSAVIIGGRQNILQQVPKEVRDAHPRLNEPLDEKQAQEMLEQCIQVLQDPSMKGSHILFADVTRLILALQLSVSESMFGKENGKPVEVASGLNLILPE
jgi:hypothetical protein